MMTQAVVWTRLQGDDIFLVESIVMLYRLQTSHEKLVKSTNITNHLGFNKADAPFLSLLGEKCKSFVDNVKPYPALTSDEIIIAREKMGKYSRQIANILNSGDGNDE